MRIHKTIAENGKRLRRLAALLAALADLAELAAGRSRAVCLLVLWLIRPGEAVVRDYLDGLAPGIARLPAPEPLRPESCAAEALRLAQKFSGARRHTRSTRRALPRLASTGARKPPVRRTARDPGHAPDPGRRHRPPRQFLKPPQLAISAPSATITPACTSHRARPYEAEEQADQGRQ